MLLPQMLEFVKHIGITVEHGGKPVKVDRIEKPLLRSINPERTHHDGTLWAWGSKGRPVAFYKLFLRGQGTRYWAHTFASTATAATGRVTASRSGRQVWVPRTAGIELKPVDDAPPPAAKQVERLQQMKALAARFSAHEFWNPNNTRYELRLIPNPVHRYSDAKSGLIDGSVFIFTHNQAPEIIMFIEASQLEADELVWQYGLAKTGGAEMHVLLDDKKVWSRPRANRRSRRPSDVYYVIDERSQ